LRRYLFAIETNLYVAAFVCIIYLIWAYYCRVEFPTSPAELNAVFDAIDKKRTGKITYQQFVSVLHNDPSVSVLLTDFIPVLVAVCILVPVLVGSLLCF